MPMFILAYAPSARSEIIATGQLKQQASYFATLCHIDDSGKATPSDYQTVSLNVFMWRSHISHFSLLSSSNIHERVCVCVRALCGSLCNKGKTKQEKKNYVNFIYSASNNKIDNFEMLSFYRISSHSSTCRFLGCRLNHSWWHRTRN